MKKKTRMIALVLVLALSFAMLPQMALTAHAATYSGTCGAEGDNLTWTLDTDLGVLTIEGSGEMEDYDYWDGSPWYDDCETITTLILPDGLTSIGANAFMGCFYLENVTIPDTVASIGECAFNSCGLTEVRISAAVTEIGDGAFVCDPLAAIYVASDNPAYCSLDGVLFNKARTELLAYPAQNPCSVYEIPEGVVTVHGVLTDCYNLTSVSVPSSVESLGDDPFANSYRLTEVQVASENEHYSSLDGVLLNKSQTELIRYPRAKADASYTVPDGVQCIKACAFFACENLQNVVIPDGVTTIEESAFDSCEALSGITLPDSIEHIRINAFRDTAYFEDENNWDGRLLYLGQWLIAARSEILTANIREGTVKIADFACSDCVSLRSVSIPDSVKLIADCAFANCSALETVAMGNGVTEIREWAFRYCVSLKNLTISDSLSFIGESAFEYCSSLESIVLPDGMISIGYDAFRHCSSLESVALPDSLTFIEERAFADCSALQSITIPGSTTELGDFAFLRCKALEEVTISDGVTSIDYAAFYDCPKLTSVVIPASVTEIGEWALGYAADEQYEDIKVKGFTIYGEEGSAAQCYAEENGFRFVSLQASSPFVDVKPSDFFFNPVLWAVENGVTGGIDETHFAPAQTVMRADAMVFFWAANQRPAFTDSSKTFKDVKKKHWAYNAVMWAVENGITGGTDAEGNYFSPQRTCTRSEILQFLYAAMGKPEYTIGNPYSDVKTKHWYYDGAIWAYEKGLEKGENGRFQAKTPCTRGYVVTYLYRYMTGLELAQ